MTSCLRACRTLLCTLALLAPATLPVRGEVTDAPGAFNASTFEERFTASAARLLADGRLKTLGELANAKLKAAPLVLPPAGSEKLEPADLHDRLLGSTAVVGLYYLCHHCDRWHFETGAGFAVAGGGVLTTCAHMLEFEPKNMRVAYPIAVDARGNVYPIVEVLAFDPVADTCLVRAEGADLAPLPMRAAGARAGESLYCLSHPGRNYFMFTSGIVSRVESREAAGRAVPFVDVTCDYSPGSSGGPIVDAAGNVVAQVATISPQLLQNDDHGNARPAATVYNFRSALAASEIIRLADPAKRLPLLAPTLAAEDHQAGGRVAPSQPLLPPPPATPAAGAAPEPVSAPGFGVSTQYDLIVAPADLPLEQQAKTFADLYGMASKNRANFISWTRDNQPRQEENINTIGVGYAGNVGYYQPPGEGRDGMVSRELDFEITYRDLKPDDSATAVIAVNDNRFTPKAADHRFKVEASVRPGEFQLVRLGPPQEGRQAWLALEVTGVNRAQQSLSGMGLRVPDQQPIDLKFTAVDGREVDTSKWRGKVILVDFWATWCGPCLKATPRVEELYRTYHDQGLEVLGVSLDQDRAAMEKYLRKSATPWPQYCTGGDEPNPLVSRFNITGIPAFLLIDRNGVGTAIDVRNPDTDDLIKARLR